HLRSLSSSPTRRSSDLHHGISHKSAIRRGRWVSRVRYHAWRTAIPRVAWTNGTMAVPRRSVTPADGKVYDDSLRLNSSRRAGARSEEHTSELQSRGHLV